MSLESQKATIETLIERADRWQVRAIEAEAKVARVEALVTAYDAAPADSDHRFLGDELADDLRAALTEGTEG